VTYVEAEAQRLGRELTETETAELAAWILVHQAKPEHRFKALRAHAFAQAQRDDRAADREPPAHPSAGLAA
jgi:hypothetical protein